MPFVTQRILVIFDKLKAFNFLRLIYNYYGTLRHTKMCSQSVQLLLFHAVKFFFVSSPSSRKQRVENCKTENISINTKTIRLLLAYAVINHKMYWYIWYGAVGRQSNTLQWSETLFVVLDTAVNVYHGKYNPQNMIENLQLPRSTSYLEHQTWSALFQT